MAYLGIVSRLETRPLRSVRLNRPRRWDDIGRLAKSGSSLQAPDSGMTPRGPGGRLPRLGAKTGASRVTFMIVTFTRPHSKCVELMARRLAHRRIASAESGRSFREAGPFGLHGQAQSEDGGRPECAPRPPPR